MNEVKVTAPQKSNACTLISVGAIDAILASDNTEQLVENLTAVHRTSQERYNDDLRKAHGTLRAEQLGSGYSEEEALQAGYQEKLLVPHSIRLRNSSKHIIDEFIERKASFDDILDLVAVDPDFFNKIYQKYPGQDFLVMDDNALLALKTTTAAIDPSFKDQLPGELDKLNNSGMTLNVDGHVTSVVKKGDTYYHFNSATGILADTKNKEELLARLLERTPDGASVNIYHFQKKPAPVLTAVPASSTAPGTPPLSLEQMKTNNEYLMVEFLNYNEPMQNLGRLIVKIKEQIKDGTYTSRGIGDSLKKVSTHPEACSIKDLLTLKANSGMLLTFEDGQSFALIKKPDESITWIRYENSALKTTRRLKTLHSVLENELQEQYGNTLTRVAITTFDATKPELAKAASAPTIRPPKPSAIATPRTPVPTATTTTTHPEELTMAADDTEKEKAKFKSIYILSEMIKENDAKTIGQPFQNVIQQFEKKWVEENAVLKESLEAFIREKESEQRYTESSSLTEIIEQLSQKEDMVCLLTDSKSNPLFLLTKLKDGKYFCYDCTSRVRSTFSDINGIKQKMDRWKTMTPIKTIVSPPPKKPAPAAPSPVVNDTLPQKRAPAVSNSAVNDTLPQKPDSAVPNPAKTTSTIIDSEEKQFKELVQQHITALTIVIGKNESKLAPKIKQYCNHFIKEINQISNETTPLDARIEKLKKATQETKKLCKEDRTAWSVLGEWFVNFVAILSAAGLLCLKSTKNTRGSFWYETQKNRPTYQVVDKLSKMEEKLADLKKPTNN